MSDFGTCDACAQQFSYDLVHNGFNDSAYAYCDRCGCTALISAWTAHPPDAPIKFQRAITEDVEPFLLGCSCGGHFRANGAPRCPSCKAALSADAAASYIEANALGTQKGWRWQRDWSGLYCIIVDHRIAKDPWRPALLPDQAGPA
jgi:hypothetical protein